MYTEYVKNFDNAIHTINTTYAKNSKFSNIMDIIHVSIFNIKIAQWGQNHLFNCIWNVYQFALQIFEVNFLSIHIYNSLS